MGTGKRNSSLGGRRRFLGYWRDGRDQVRDGL